MAGMELGRSTDSDLNKMALLEAYQEEINSDVRVIHQRFDAVVAKQLGFKGSIFEAFRQSVRRDEDDKYYVHVKAMPEVLQPYMIPPKTDDSDNVIEQAKFKYESYDPEYEGIGYEIGEYGPFDGDAQEVRLFRGSTDINFHAQRGRVKLLAVEENDFYGNSDFDFLTQRTVNFVDEPSHFEVLKIGQKKKLAKVRPLVYGNLDQEEAVSLHLYQGVYDLNGGYTETRLQEKANRVEVKAGGEIFHFPLKVKPRDELAETLTRLGI